MSQISQPMRIALLAVIVIAAAYFLLLRPHQASTSTPSPTPGTPSAAAPATTAPATTTPAPAASGPLPPGVAGLARAVQHARDAVGASQVQAKAAQNASPTASGPAVGATGGVAATTATPAPATGATAASPAATAATAHPAPTTAVAPASTATSGPQGATAAGAARVLAGPTGAAAAPATGAPVAHAAAPKSAATPAHHHPAIPVIEQVQQELAAGKTVAILFWNPNGSDDENVHHQLSRIDRQDGNVVTHVATAAQVTDYGTVTSNVQVYETPTIVIVNPKGQASTLVGLQDYTTINQAIGDAEQAAGADQLPALTAFTPHSPRAAYVHHVNAVCRRDIRSAGTFNLGSQSQVAKYAASENRFLNSIEHVAPPAADGDYIDEAIAHERKALSQLNASVAASGRGDDVGSRTLLLEAVTNDDRAGIMFTTYGLTGCLAANNN